MKRRTAIQSAVLAAAAASTGLRGAAGEKMDPNAVPLTGDLATGFSAPVFIATWPFGKAACQKSQSVLAQGGSLLDAVERGINVTELDTSVDTVGYGGLPNADGDLQLDASFMDGRTQDAGAVAAIKGYRNPISIARKVMEQTKHVLLAGEDAAAFAKQAGFESQDTLTPEAKAAWLEWRSEQSQLDPQPVDTHDTIALLGLAEDGHLVGGCSTSGLAFKLPGRVGDSPLIGAGLYVDGEIGAAGATGVGENILRYCGSFLIVEYMRQGMLPTAACEATIRRIAKSERKSPSELSVNFVAMNKAGVIGSAGTDADFQCAVVDAKQSVVIQPLLVN